MTRLRITDIEAELRASGHQVERTLEDGPDQEAAFSDAQWRFRVDGELVAHRWVHGDARGVRESGGSANRQPSTTRAEGRDG